MIPHGFVKCQKRGCRSGGAFSIEITFFSCFFFSLVVFGMFFSMHRAIHLEILVVFFRRILGVHGSPQVFFMCIRLEIWTYDMTLKPENHLDFLSWMFFIYIWKFHYNHDFSLLEYPEKSILTEFQQPDALPKNPKACLFFRFFLFVVTTDIQCVRRQAAFKGQLSKVRQLLQGRELRQTRNPNKTKIRQRPFSFQMLSPQKTP